MFSKKGVLQKRKLSYPFQSMSYNNLVIRKQLYFLPTFLKSWVHSSDNTARVVGGSQYKYRGYRHRDFPLFNNDLDDSLHSKICWVWKKLN